MRRRLGTDIIAATGTPWPERMSQMRQIRRARRRLAERANESLRASEFTIDRRRDSQSSQPPGEICEEFFNSIAGSGDPFGDLFGGEGDDSFGDFFDEFFASLFGIHPCAGQHAART
jgi:hypothetical protein